MRKEIIHPQKRGISFLVVFWALTVCHICAADYRQLVSEGDNLLRRSMTAAYKSGEALAKYRQALKLHPDEYDILYRASCALYYLGLAANCRREQEGIFQEGITLAQKAVAVNPRGVAGHFWLGVNYAKYGEARGVLKSLFLVADIKDEMLQVIALDEHYAKASAYTILGRLYYLVPGIFGGSNRKARMYLEKGRQLSPDNTTTLLFLAELFSETGNEELAKKALRELLALPQTADTSRESFIDKDAARKMLSHLE